MPPKVNPETYERHFPPTPKSDERARKWLLLSPPSRLPPRSLKPSGLPGPTPLPLHAQRVHPRWNRPTPGVGKPVVFSFGERRFFWRCQGLAQCARVGDGAIFLAKLTQWTVHCSDKKREEDTGTPGSIAKTEGMGSSA